MMTSRRQVPSAPWRGEEALKSCGINHEYISLLKKMYKDQKASVQTDVESNMFEIKKGTKQGDPVSSLF